MEIISVLEKNLIFGGWSEYLYILPGSHLFKYPDSLDPRFGTFIEPLSVTGCLIKQDNGHQNGNHLEVEILL